MSLVKNYNVPGARGHEHSETCIDVSAIILSVAWFCETCDAELYRDEYDTASELPQEAAWRACNEFNEKSELRVCPRCGSQHDVLDLKDVRWPEVAKAIRAES